MAVDDSSPRDAAKQIDDETNLGGVGEPIHLSGLRKEFGDVVAVEDLSLRVEAGEFLVLLGPSGCGKTTTLRMIAGLETPTGGEIRIGDETVTRTLPQKRDLSMVFQSYALYPHKTVRGNLAFPLGKMDVDDNEQSRRIERAAEILEIDDLLDKEPGQLSGGQRQRVALGRTIIREPRAFLMDEPLSNLDAKLRVQTRSELRQLQQDLGTTTVYVTHDQEEAMSLADRIAVMNDGEIQQVGSPKEVYENPANEFVAGFIGEPAMNFFDVDTDGQSNQLFPEDPVRLDADLPAETDTVGVRPEHVDAVPVSAEQNGRETADEAYTDSFESELLLVEPLGNAYELKLERGGVTFTARLRELSDELRDGTVANVAFEVRGINSFAADGRTLQSGGERHG